MELQDDIRFSHGCDYHLWSKPYLLCFTIRISVEHWVRLCVLLVLTEGSQHKHREKSPSLLSSCSAFVSLIPFFFSISLLHLCTSLSLKKNPVLHFPLWFSPVSGFVNIMKCPHHLFFSFFPRSRFVMPAVYSDSQFTQKPWLTIT